MLTLNRSGFAATADFAEAQLDNNRNCLSLNEQLNVEPPFPNPASEQLRVSVILPVAGGVSLRLLNQDGRTEQLLARCEGLAGGAMLVYSCPGQSSSNIEQGMLNDEHRRRIPYRQTRPREGIIGANDHGYKKNNTQTVVC